MNNTDGTQVKSLPANVEETQGTPTLSWEGPLEEETATHSCILVLGKNSWTEKPGGLQSMAATKSRMKPGDCRHTHTKSHIVLKMGVKMAWRKLTEERTICVVLKYLP